MSELDIYVNAEGNVRKQSKWKTETNSSERIYENDTCHAVESKKTGPRLSGLLEGEKVKKSSFRAAAVILTLLCLLLLAAVIILVFLYTKGSSDWRMEKIQLETRYENLAEEQDLINKKLQNLTIEWSDFQRSLQGWTYFGGSFYYFSSTEKSWKQSRADCLQKGADLVIINSMEEQEFVRRCKQRTWIGLTDIEKEGTWKWVDETQINTSFRYWAESEPNNAKENEDCAEIYQFELQNCWNDAPCEVEKYWICEFNLSKHTVIISNHTFKLTMIQ